MSQYLIVLERTVTGFGVYVPDLPGCVSAGRTKEEAERNAHEAIELHLQGLRDAGQEIPEPTAKGAYVTVAV